MKILHIATGFPVSFPGGITNYLRSLVTRQREQGEIVDILAAPEPAVQTPSTVSSGRIIPFNGVASVFSLSILRKSPSLSANLTKLLAEYDVAHFHMSYGIPIDFYNAAIPIPYVVSLHDYSYICPRIFMVDKWNTTCNQRDLNKCQHCVGFLEQINILRAGSNRIGFKLPTISSRAASRRAAALDGFLRNAKARLAVSKRVSEIFADAVPDANFETLHIGNETAGPIPQRHNWMPQNKLRACFLGTLNRDKGAEVLFEIARSLPQNRCEISFWGRCTPDLIHSLSRLGIKNCGPYQPNMLPNILKDVDVGMVLPIWNDNGPQVLMEFLNQGVPVLGTNMGGIPDFLDSSTGFIFDPSTQLNAAVHWLATLTPEALSNYHMNIKPLKTPADHAAAVLGVYRRPEKS
jgi:glycosyltransferase involved in cell wall biosynthesis